MVCTPWPFKESTSISSNLCGISGVKNYGLCHKEKGESDEEANNLPLKARRVAGIELEDDHKWKVMFETQLALLYHCVGRAQEAKEVMKKGLAMNKRLRRSISQLANTFEIKLFLNFYPDTHLWNRRKCRHSKSSKFWLKSVFSVHWGPQEQIFWNGLALHSASNETPFKFTEVTEV